MKDNFQDRLKKSLVAYHSNYCHSTQRWVKGMTEPYPCDCDIQDTTQSLTHLNFNPKMDNSSNLTPPKWTTHLIYYRGKNLTKPNYMSLNKKWTTHLNFNPKMDNIC